MKVSIVVDLPIKPNDSMSKLLVNPQLDCSPVYVKLYAKEWAAILVQHCPEIFINELVRELESE